VRSLVAVIGGAGADLYDTPDGAKVQDLPMAATVTAALRNAAGDWVFVTTNEGASGWTLASGLVAFGLERLPVLDVTADGAAEEAAGETAVAEPVATEPAAATVTETDAQAAATEEAGAEEAVTEETAAPPAAGVPATVTITEQRLNIRSGPGADYRIIEKAQPGEVLTATARTADSAWVRVWRADLGDSAGWAAAEYLAVENLAGLPVDDSLVLEDAAESAPTPAAPADAAEDAAADDSALPTATPIPAEDAPESTATETPATEAATGAEAGGEVAALVAANALAPAAAIAAQPAGLQGTLAFQDGRNNIYLYNLASGDVRWLTNGFDPDLSPDGSRVTFVRGGGDVNGVWTINTDGSNERHIHGGGEIMRGPKWSPDGDWIVFSRNNTNWKCFDLEFFGCVSFFELQGKFPQIPPPILYRIFLRDADRLEKPNWIITRVNPDGGEFRDLNALDSAVSPDWNEAGIVYQAKPGLEITEDTPDGRTRSVQHDGWDWDPDWQPGGGRIVYQSKEGSHWEIWSINPDGSDVFALTRPETTLVDQLPSNAAPAFSPDGQHIVYISNRTADEEAGPWRLWVMDNGGGNKRPLPIDIAIDYNFSSDQVVSWAQ
jgi:SH3-like domain-containing protein